MGGGPPFGIFGLNTTRAERDWPDALVKRLQLVAQLFTNALARKRADQALRESEERMALAAEAAGFGVWGWNIARNQIWGSERWRYLFGFASGEDVSFEKVIQRIHPDDREKVGREVRDALANGRNYAGEFRVALPDGTERWIASRGRGYKDASGKLVRMLGAAVDITHRKRTELELAESELRYRALFEAAPEGILLIGTDGHVRTANASQARLYGYESPQQLEGLYAPLCVADKDRERSRQTMRDLLKGEEQPTRCYTAVRRDRSEFIVEVTSAILRGPGRDVQGYLCLTRDITEAKRAEVALRTSEGRLQAGADLAGLGCYEINHAEPSSFADERFGEICGVAPGKQPDLQRMQFWIEHLHPADSERVLEERRKLYEGKVERYDVEYRYLHPAHGQKWIHHLGRVAAGDASGRAIHLYGVVQDITDRKQAEEELQRLRLHLWHADRVAQTGAITASLAHELNQPLTAILSNAQAGLRFMDGGNPDLGEIREILTDIVHDDKRAGAVISGLRNMLRRKETQRERINLASTIEEILALVHSELVGQQIELRLRLEPDSLVLADKGQVQQVILNLVTNAVQAMQDQPASQRRLKLTLTRTNTGEALVAVRDSGPGIPEDQQGKLFEGFWTTKHEGLGIGLPISRSIVETHGGRLSFTNNPDQGATFSFTLPLATNPDSFRTASGSAAGPGATEANEQD